MTDIAGRGQQAQRLLDDPVLNEALAAIVQEQVALWAKSPWDAPAKREENYMLVVAVDRLRGKLRTFVEDAAFEAARTRA